MVVLFCKTFRQLQDMFLFRRERNEPMMVNQAKFSFQSICVSLYSFITKYRYTVYVKTNYIFCHVLSVNSHCSGRCYVKKLIPLCTFLKFHTHLQINAARLCQNVFNKCLRQLTVSKNNVPCTNAMITQRELIKTKLCVKFGGP